MALTNTNKFMVDLPKWEQLTSAPVASAAGAAFTDDNVRYAYALFSATEFHRYDAYTSTFQRLASPPAGTVAAGSCLTYLEQIGGQVNGATFGSVFAFRASATSVAFAKYDIATDTWSAALSVVNIPATWGTGGRLICPEPAKNGYEGGYHNATALNTITTTASAAINATSITVAALPLAMPIGARLNFGTAAAPIWAVLTVAAAAAATSITVAPLIAAVGSGAVAYWYADMFLVGNNAAVMYRYNLNAAAWVLTSSNAGNPALPTLSGNMGAGCTGMWLPASGAANALNTLTLVRAGAVSQFLEYNMLTNTAAALVYYPNVETFTTGSCASARSDANGKQKYLLLRQHNTGKVFCFDRLNLRLTPVATQNLIAEGTAVDGDKMFLLRSPDGIEYLYCLLNTSTFFLRTGLIL